MYYFKTSEE